MMQAAKNPRWAGHIERADDVAVASAPALTQIRPCEEDLK
jgi:hypothetical protein